MWSFLRQTLASCLGFFVALSLFSVLGVSSVALILFGLVEPEETATVKDKSILVLDLSQPIQDTDPLDSLQQSIVGETTSSSQLRDVLKAIELAAEDDRIVGLLLDGSPGSNGSGYAILQEVREALVEFKESDKLVLAYDVNWGEGEYYLGSLADRVYMNPMGALELNGLSIQQTFYAEALEKFGVGVQIVRAGEYKSAIEPFVRQELSQESEEQFSVLLGDVWRDILGVISQDRPTTSQGLQGLVESQGFLFPQEAKRAKLVDELAYEDEVAKRLREVTEQEEEEETGFRHISVDNYLLAQSPLDKDNSSEQKIALVYAQGPIVYGEGELNEIGSDRVVRQLRKIRDNEDIKAVVVRINSPGGSATASEVILRELQLLKEEKPVVVSMGNLAASGGYWIAMGSDYIVAQSNTITGSIGVFGVLPNIQEIANENGVSWDTVKTGPFADSNTITRPKTEAEMTQFQESVDRVYELFLDKVVKSRDLSRSKVAEIAQGRVWSGEDAKRLGLVDAVGGIETAISQAAEMAELGEDWQVEEYQTQPDWEELLLRRFTLQLSSRFSPETDPITSEFQGLQQQFRSITDFSDPKGVYSRLPFALIIK